MDSVRPLRSRSRLERGFGLLQVMLLIAVLGGLSTMGYLEWRERTAVENARLERLNLSQADQALQTFATVARRLPCPDTDRDGLEDCGGTDQKGWLPATTLRMAGADPGVDIGQIRYVVQRGAGAFDLTVLDDAWRPLEYDDDAASFFAMRETPTAGTYQANIHTLADFCQRLQEGAGTTLTADMAQVNASPARAVAYALAHPGDEDTDGDGSLFDGANAGATSMLEDPQRVPLLAAYDDIVLDRSFGALRTAFHCEILADSINTVALAHDISSSVDEMKEENIEAATRAIIFASIGAAITAVETAGVVIEGISDAGNAAAEWVICIASLGIAANACAAAGIHTAAAALTAGVIIANVASIAANVTAAVLAGNALALADSSVDASSLSCTVPDLTTQVNQAKAELDDAIADRQAIVNQIAAKQTELNNAVAARNQAIANLRYWVRLGTDWSSIDGRVDAVLSSANSWGTANDSYSAAQADVQRYQDAVTNWTATRDDYANMIANRTTLISQLQSEIAALDTQIAAETNQTTKAALQQQRLEKTARLTLLQDATALQNEYNKAVTELASAQSSLSAAQSAMTVAQGSINTAQSSYATNYNSLLNAGRYQLHVGLSVYDACTTSALNVCQQNDYLTYGIIQQMLGELFGPASNIAVAPGPDSIYYRPAQIQKEIDALNDSLAAADDRIDAAQDSYDTLKAKADNPPPCNITGSGVTPMPPSAAESILINVDIKGGTR
ncbi:hypothetical protein [Hydrogenophaga sp. MI9]|uniref:hypothetical protein n=1 Tax=Hydrogenophaga sp. MI9 TaxID=3453719 RepID=UPI003EEAD06D